LPLGIFALKLVTWSMQHVLMRVIAGKFKGFSLRSVSKTKVDIRPTTDKVKEALFNILGTKIIDSDFADLFSGCGHIGIEAISRGANYVVFVDNNYKCIKIIKESIYSLEARTSYDNINYDIFNQDVFKFISNMKMENKFNIIFIDPPYHTNLIEKCLLKIDTCDILKKSGLIIVETSAGRIISDKIRRFEKFREEIYGNNKLLFFKNSRSKNPI